MTEREQGGSRHAADVLEESSLGDPAVVALAAEASADALTDVLGRLSRLDQRVAETRRDRRPSTPIAHGPLVEWRRELDQLRRRITPERRDELPERLRPYVGTEHADRRVLRQGRHARARRLFARLLADLRRTVGARHPDTLRCRTRYVETLRLTGRWDDAWTETEDLVRELVATLGEDAVETMRGREELGWLAHARADTASARRILADVLERRRRVLGDDHSDTLRSVEDVDGLR